MRRTQSNTAFAVALLYSTLAAASINLSPFIQPILDILPQSYTNATAQHELLKRQYSNTCPTGYNNCANMGAAGLCCNPSAVCSADYAGNVACCPTGAACTGTISGVITAGTVDNSGALVGATAGTADSSGLVTASTTTNFEFASSTSNGLVAASTQTTVATDGSATTGSGFIIDGTSTVATPGAAGRAADIPFVIKGLLRVLEYVLR